ncbi:carboxyltransferase domain-containing protein [Micromonospora sp. NPDC049044]|uniref:5-oxoprolinase subunit B family protein n=1 Tax=Micromonospora sp. NPDC049044 TaxID=3154827 RepID=UPI0033D004EB
MRIRPVGARALLIDCTAPAGSSDAALVEAWRAELWRRRAQGDLVAVEIVPAASTVLLDGLPDPAGTAEQLARWAPGVTAVGVVGAGGGAGDSAGAAAEVVVPVVFDGPDLPVVAEQWGVDVPTVLRRLTGTRFRVAFCGFAPGFPYLTGLPDELALPRLATPRPRVPAGSVALAGPYAGIYPSASPGGWLLVGRTELVLFDVHADPPARLGPGTQVRMAAA